MFIGYLKKMDKKTLVLLIVILILIIVNIALYVSNKRNQKPMLNTQNNVSNDQNNNVEVKVPQTEEEINKKLSELGERDRIEYYCGEYFKHIEKKEYSEAYKVLYSEFKEKYFPTEEQFKEYIEKTYPKVWALEYDDILRQGDVYVLELNILDVFGTKDSKTSQRIVVKENYYNDYTISFQVIENK